MTFTNLKVIVLIYILPPSLKILENRLKERAVDSEKEIDIRINEAFNELKDSIWYDYIVINDDLEKAVSRVEAIIISDRCRNACILLKIKETFKL